MTKSVRYTDVKVESMYKKLSELEIEHKRFRRKIGQIELGPNVCVITRTIPVEKSIDAYEKKNESNRKGSFVFRLTRRKTDVFVFVLEETLDEFFASKPSISLLNDVEDRPNETFGSKNDEPLEFRFSLVEYSDSD